MYYADDEWIGLTKNDGLLISLLQLRWFGFSKYYHSDLLMILYALYIFVAWTYQHELRIDKTIHNNND